MLPVSHRDVPKQQKDGDFFDSVGNNVNKFGRSAATGALKGFKAVNSVFDDFKNFLDRGNVVDLAVGIVMGTAFTAIVTSLVQDLVTPWIGLASQGNLKNNFVILRCPKANDTGVFPPVFETAGCKGVWATVAEAQKAGAVTFNWGNFLETVINFVIISAIIFFIVKVYAATFRRKKAEAPKKTKECVYCCKDIPIKAARCPDCTSTLPEPQVESAPDVVIIRDQDKKDW
ncbi:large-conductance mechanosensitive channel [Gaertneriomyces semiglobifer]|nr:large-conductance mechanosensitive channel [Gaertneriomyces semiglobifer]